jgi:zinc resistance-associated protein
MWKPAVVVAAVMAVAGSSVVYAQQHMAGPDRDGPRFEHRHPLSAEDRAAFVDARIAALKAGLELTPDQAKNWPDFEKALRDMAQLRAERIAAREAAEHSDKAPSEPFDRLAQHADNMAKTSAALKRIAEAGKPLYGSLDDSQKARFQKLAWLLRPHHHPWHARFLEGPEGHGWGHGDDDGGPMWRHHWRNFGEDDGGAGGMRRMMDEGHRMMEEGHHMMDEGHQMMDEGQDSEL